MRPTKGSGSPDGERSGRCLKALRNLMDLKQEGLADLLAVHPSHIGQLESGHRAMSHDLEVTLHLLTGVDWDWLSGAKGDDETPLSVVDQPLTPAMIKARLAWDQSRDVSHESQRRSIQQEMLDWARALRAAARGGKLTVAIGRSVRARLDFLKSASVGPWDADDGYLFDRKLPPHFLVAARESTDEDRREELLDQLSLVLSPVLLLEISHALNKKPEVTRYIGMLQKAMDALVEFEQLRRQHPPRPARLGKTKPRFKPTGPSSEQNPAPDAVKRRSATPSKKSGRSSDAASRRTGGSA